MNSSLVSSSPKVLSQTKAPVIKFQCLFSHDLRRKAKRWQDGYLNFHTFNKRIMVYDLTANSIGDLHWRRDSQPCDGDELELERGVLVQVGECIEKSQTDLTELLDKRKSQHTLPPPKASSPQHRAPASFRNPAAPQPLKSLNELLGIKRTPIGKATLTTKSPYEIRNRGTETTNRAPKRQKLAAPYDIRTNEDGRTKQTTSLKRSGQDENVRNGNEATCGEENVLPVNPAPSIATTKPLSKAGQTFQDSRRSITKVTTKRSSSGSSVEPSTSRGSTGTLHIAAEKPRKKLIYSDVLGKRDAVNQSAAEGSGTPSSHSDKVHKSKLDSKNVSDGSSYSGFKTAALASADINMYPGFLPSGSTLLSFKESTPPPSSQNCMTIDNFFKPSARNSKVSENENGDPPRENQGTSNYSRDTEGSTRSLLRSNSDTSPLVGHRTDKGTASPQLHNPSEVVHKIPARSLQKTTSDTSTLKPLPKPKHQAVLASNKDRFVDAARLGEEKEEEQGPWTTEALDLFDWWPAGRTKPNTALQT